MDPHTNTREEFTHGLVSKPIPDNAAPEWRRHVERHKVLLEKLAQHPAMAPNLGQTYMTPAKSKNNVYFQWDFIGRSLGFMYSVNPTLQNLSKAERERWQDAVGRATYAKMLITVEQDD